MTDNGRDEDVAVVIGHREESDVIDDFIDEHGIDKLSEFVDHTHYHAEGRTTIRIIADQLDLSHEEVYHMLAEVQPLLGISPDPMSTSGEED